MTACSAPEPDSPRLAQGPGQQSDSEQAADAPKTRGDRILGHLVWGHESRFFRECDSGRDGWVINASGGELVEVYRELTSTPYQEMFVEVRAEWEAAPVEGFAAAYVESLRIHQLIRAENEGWGCRGNLSGVMFVASGNEPSWHLEVRDEGITFSSLHEAGPLNFPPAEPSRQGNGLRILSRGKDYEISVSLERQRCVDSMSGARFAFAANVELRGNRYTGCAIEGNESP